jgi:NitT/TauT family transport system substrate-binding protein
MAREGTMRRAILPLSVLTLLLGVDAALAQDHLKVAIGNRNVGETFVTELGDKAGIFKKHGLSLDIFYTDGGGETQQAVISNSAQIGVAVGFLGVLGVYAKGAPVRVIGSSFTGGTQMFWYVPANSPIRSEKDLTGRTVAYSTNGASTHLAVLALQKHTGVAFKPAATGNAASTYTQVMSGQIDVGWAGAPFGVQALDEGKIRVIMKSSDPPELNKQTVRLIIANASELAQRRDVFVRFMRAYRETLDWLYTSPDAIKAYSAYSGMSEGAVKRALQEFLPREALDPDRLSAVDAVMADAVSFKYLPAPLSKAQLDELVQIPERKPQASQ